MLILCVKSVLHCPQQEQILHPVTVITNKTSLIVRRLTKKFNFDQSYLSIAVQTKKTSSLHSHANIPFYNVIFPQKQILLLRVEVLTNNIILTVAELTKKFLQCHLPSYSYINIMLLLNIPCRIWSQVLKKTSLYSG